MIADINLTNKKCLILGGGEQAYKKVVKLTDCGACVTVISSEFSSLFESLNVEKIYERYNSGFLKGYFLVIAATDNCDVNNQIISDCSEHGILSASVNGGGDISFCSEREVGKIKISVSTGGNFPLLSKRLADRFCSETEEYGYNTELLKKCRQTAFEKIGNQQLCRKYFDELLKCKNLDEHKANDIMNKYVKRAILTVSFGTVNADAEDIYVDLKKEFCGFEIRRSFTCQNIRNILKERDNIEILPPDMAVKRLIEDGYRDILIAAANIIPGYEYDKLQAVAKQYNIKITKPLLHSDNIKSAAEAIKSISAKDAANVWVGHGTNHASCIAYKDLENLIGRKNIIIGTINGFMNIDYVIKSMENNGYKDIVLRPLMYDMGNNAQNDIFKGDYSWKAQLEAHGYKVRCIINGLRGEKEIRQLIFDEIKRMECDYERDNDKCKRCGTKTR